MIELREKLEEDTVTTSVGFQRSHWERQFLPAGTGARSLQIMNRSGADFAQLCPNDRANLHDFAVKYQLQVVAKSVECCERCVSVQKS